MKHAFLIMAHNEPCLLETLMSQLQDPEFDVYVHIDKGIDAAMKEKLQSIVLNRGGCLVPSVKVHWGDFSIVEAELELFSTASKKSYDYYHLLSGVDLLIKNSLYVKDFFEKNKGKEFFRIFPNLEEEHKHDKNGMRRDIDYWFFFMKLRSTKIVFVNIFFKILHRLFLYIQQRLSYSRIAKDDFISYRGDEWCSLTHEAVSYLLSQEHFIRKRFHFCACADEFYKQTVLMNSKFKNKRFLPEGDKFINECLREIDWRRGHNAHPWIWRMSDFDHLKKSHNIFARKFSTKIDKDIIMAMKSWTEGIVG